MQPPSPCSRPLIWSSCVQLHTRSNHREIYDIYAMIAPPPPKRMHKVCDYRLSAITLILMDRAILAKVDNSSTGIKIQEFSPIGSSNAFLKPSKVHIQNGTFVTVLSNLSIVKL